MKDQIKIHGPEVPNYALLNEALLAKSAQPGRATKAPSGKRKTKTAQSQRRDTQANS